MEEKKLTGAENVRWDLSYLYENMDDPQINEDLRAFEDLCKVFCEKYRGKLDTRLEGAVLDGIRLKEIRNKFNYFFLAFSVDTANPEIKSRKARVEERFDKASADLEFFNIELVGLNEDDILVQAEASVVLKHHLPYIENIRRFKDHLLSEDVEIALRKRSAFGTSAWEQFYEERCSALRFDWEGEKKNLSEMLTIMSNDHDREKREKALVIINDGFAGEFVELAAFAFYQVAGNKRVSDEDRGYRYPRETRDMSNKLDKATVEALHESILTKTELVKRFYSLKARLLRIEGPLKWSDRNAPIEFGEQSFFPFSLAVDMVMDAVNEFSPTMTGLVQRVINGNFVDAPTTKNKRGGAYCACTAVEGSFLPYVLLNYQGRLRDVTTFAHELGHAAHGLLAHEKQGSHMWAAPMAYAETASVFVETIVTKKLLYDLLSKGDKRGALSLLMATADDTINTVYRQISFSQFEKALHEDDGRLSVKELNKNWLEVTRQVYGEDGEVFSYENTEHLWCYIHHFFSPFYVYAYPVGLLFTNSLFAVKDEVEDFEAKYLDLLRAGGTKDAIELLKPFGLDPTNPDFWNKGIDISLGATIEMAEKLVKEIGE